MKLILPGLLFAGVWATSPWRERQNTRAQGAPEWSSQAAGPWTPFNENYGPHARDRTVRYAAFPRRNITGYQGKSRNAVLFSTQIVLSSLCVLSEGKSLSYIGVLDEVSLHLISVSSVMMKLPLISVYLLRVSRLLIFFPSVRLTLPPFCVLSEDKYSSYICVLCEVKSSSYLCPQWCKIFLISVLSEDVFLLYLCPQWE